MRSEEYLAKAAEFEALTIGADAAPTLQKRYADLALTYRLLAKEQAPRIAEGIIASDPPPP